MKINGKEILGVGIIETALDGLDAKEYCLLVTYKKERKNNRGYDIRKTTLPEIVKRNNDLALAIPEFVGENMTEGAALAACAKFAEKFGINILPIEQRRIDDLRAISAAKKAAKTENAENNSEKRTAATSEKKAKKTAAEKIVDIISGIKDVSDNYKLNQLLPAIESVNPAIAEQVAEVFRRAMIPEAGKVETAAK